MPLYFLVKALEFKAMAVALEPVNDQTGPLYVNYIDLAVKNFKVYDSYYTN